MSLIKIINYVLVIMTLSIQTAAGCYTAPVIEWGSLLDSNKKFVKNRGFARQRARFKTGQNPPVIVLSCSDSRVPPELIFDQTLGAFFVIRVAGQVVDQVVINSIEFAVRTFNSHVIVVLGHSRCGAVSGALEHLQKHGGTINKPHDEFNAVLIPIETAIIESGIDIHGESALEEAVQANVKYIAHQLLSRSGTISDALNNGNVIIVGAEYFIDTGKVDELFVKCRKKQAI